MKKFVFILFLGLSLLFGPSTSTFTLSEESPLYDHSASTECKAVPEDALYNGGILEKQAFETPNNSTAFVFDNIQADTIYAFSSWIKITGSDSAQLRATIDYDNVTRECVGNVLANNGCWSFLKGGFVLQSPLINKRVVINFSDDFNQTNINILVSGASLQPFTPQQWEKNQQHVINTERKRTATLHVLDTDGNRLHGAKVVVNQVSRDFPFGTAVSKRILENKKYQDWFLERFNTAVFENELKWGDVELEQGKPDYTIPDQMLKFLRSKQISVRGHNVLWEHKEYVPLWLQKETNPEVIKAAVQTRMNSVMKRYKDEFVHWDVNNEILPYDFYKSSLGLNSSIEFYRAAQELDPRTRMFMNEFNTLERCDGQCSVDRYVAKLRELMNNGVTNLGIGLQSHFPKPNPALIRGSIDKLATLNLPIWLTELDISKKSVTDKNLQAKYMEVALREGFSHPSVNGIMMWTSWGPLEDDCYRMCLQDPTFTYYPAAYTVDKLLKEWETKEVKGETNDQGIFNFSGFLGEYKVSVTHGNKSRDTTLSLPHSHDTKHWNIYL